MVAPDGSCSLTCAPLNSVPADPDPMLGRRAGERRTLPHAPLVCLGDAAGGEAAEGEGGAGTAARTRASASETAASRRSSTSSHFSSEIGVVMTASLAERLEAWVETHYRSSLSPEELVDDSLLSEGRAAFYELESILDLKIVHSEF